VAGLDPVTHVLSGNVAPVEDVDGRVPPGQGGFSVQMSELAGTGNGHSKHPET